jgi:hypothetical protein
MISIRHADRAAIALFLVVAGAATAAGDDDTVNRNFVGSVQFDYMAVPSRSFGREVGLDGATIELSLKLVQDLGQHVSSSVKLCVACHGLEVGMAFFDLRVADELNFRVGRFTPTLGEFPIRHDPASHRTSDKPLPYDMGRMLRLREWNLGVLPSPWVDNGIEINGTHFFGSRAQVDYAVFGIAGPRAPENAADFDFAQSRSGQSFYVDNNSRPSFGGQLAASLSLDELRLTIGAGVMTGTYDPAARLKYRLYAAHAVLRFKSITLRGEYLRRRTRMDLGTDPASRFKYGPRSDGTYDSMFLKDGFYLELELPVASRVEAVLRWDGLHRVGNVLVTSPLTDDAGVLRYTAGLAITIYRALRIKLSGELYDFRDFDNEVAIHAGLAGPF